MHSSPHGLKIFCFRLYRCICHQLKRWCTQVHTDWKYSVFGCICAFATCLRGDALKSTRTENILFSVVSLKCICHHQLKLKRWCTQVMHSSPHGLKIFCFRLYLCICHQLKRWWSTHTENLMFSVVSVHSPPSQSRNTGINMLWGGGLCKQLYMQMRIHLFSTDNFSNLIFL